MPIWSEVLVLSLAAYAIGLGAGWFIWGRKPAAARIADTPDGPHKDVDLEESP